MKHTADGSWQEYRFGVDMLRHLGSLSKFAEVSLVCAADICRAAVYVNPDEEAPLRLLALDVVHEIRVSFIPLHVQKHVRTLDLGRILQHSVS